MISLYLYDAAFSFIYKDTSAAATLRHGHFYLWQPPPAAAEAKNTGRAVAAAAVVVVGAVTSSCLHVDCCYMFGWWYLHVMFYSLLIW